jgi:DNA-binding transcriptional LysR family regulator
VVHTGLPEIVRAFRKRFSRVDVRLQEMNPAMQVDALIAERIDVGFVRGPIDEPTLASKTVFKEPMVAVLPCGHRLGGHKILGLAMLAKEPFVFQARSRGPAAHDHILAICRKAGFSPQIVQEGSYTDLLSLVASGAGVAIVPTSLRAIRRAGVLFRPLRERPMTQLDIVWCQDAASPVLREFLEHVWRLGARGIRPRVG